MEKKQKEADITKVLASFFLFYIPVYLILSGILSVFSLEFRSLFPGFFINWLSLIPISFVIIVLKIFLLSFLFYIVSLIFNVALDLGRVFSVWLNTWKIVLAASPVILVLALVSQWFSWLFVAVYIYVIFKRVKLVAAFSSKSFSRVFVIYIVCLAVLVLCSLLLINSFLDYLEPYIGLIV